ncbi:replication protein [uncultured Acinetobacter sp.]|uniref:replication protein n=1 Tax=uncultured Acinetobacter sp. TaxID=165433 RepID=UPI0025D84611|nr:replication protein [uncultured Acinetobacter sp.]
MNLAHKHDSPQGEVIEFPKQERQVMSKKEEGHTRLPNTLIDDQIMAQLKDKAFKCLMFIVRQTIGFNRSSHTIAISQFQKYCGIKKRDTVMSSISELEDANLIKVARKTGCLNEYFLTLDQYHQSGLVPSKGSTTKRDGTSTVKRDGTSTVKRDTIKETFKENIKESSSEGKPQFKVQENVMAGYVTYFMNDAKYYSLFELESLYSVDVDFVHQALASYPSLTLKIDNFSEMFNEMRQWSLTANAGKKQPQQWMNTWLTWVKNNAHKFNEKPKQSTYQPRAKAQPTPRIGSNKRNSEKTVNPIVLEVRDV